MPSITEEVTIQPVMSRLDSLWYYEWFAGVSQTDWRDPVQAEAADRLMIESLKRHRSATRGIPLGVNLAFMTAAYCGSELVTELTKLLPAGSVIEITEHASNEASQAEIKGLVKTCAAIKNAQFQLALDDCDSDNLFGDTALWDLVDPDIIKIDMRSLTALGTAKKAQALRRPTIYECIESVCDRVNALRWGACGLQGYALAYPMAISRSFIGTYCA